MMELPYGLNRRYATLAVVLLAGIWLWVAFDRPYVFPDHVPWNIYSNGPQSPNIDVFDFPPLTSPAIKSVCAKTAWNSGLIFTCDSPSGNFAEVRNSILHCVRYTIAAGGSLVLPRIVLNQAYGGRLAGNTTSLDHLFDSDHFTASLQLSCPQLRVYKSTPGMKDEATKEPIALLADTLVSSGAGAIEDFPVEWRAAFYNWLKKSISGDFKGPRVIALGRSYLHYPVHSDDENFALHFGKILKIRSDARVLATTTLLKLKSEYSLPLDLKDPYSNNGFMGVYLSTKSNPDQLTNEDQDYGSYDTQSRLYLDYIAHSNSSPVYVASDNGPDMLKFLSAIREWGIEATAKFDVLKGRDREDMQDMTAQQQELVDYLVMSDAVEFVGVGTSSFTWDVAFRRHGFARNTETSLDQDQQFNDGISVIYGTTGGHPEFSASMWP